MFTVVLQTMLNRTIAPSSDAWSFSWTLAKMPSVSGKFWVYPNLSTSIFHIFNNLLSWNRPLMPRSGTRRSVGSRWHKGTTPERQVDENQDNFHCEIRIDPK
jgi:hypothetical protein